MSGVGNHEFDEGLDEVYRMMNGGCHPVDGCQDGTPFLGSIFGYLAANVFFEGTDDTVLPPYEIRKVDNAKIAFIGMTLEGTPLVVTPSAIAGPRVPRRGRDGECARGEAPRRGGRPLVRDPAARGRHPERAVLERRPGAGPAGLGRGQQLRQPQRRDRRHRQGARRSGRRRSSAATRTSSTSAPARRRSTASSSRARRRSAASSPTSTSSSTTRRRTSSRRRRGT